MSESQFPTGNRQLDEILAGYLRAAEAGNTQSEDEVVQRFPQFADQLRDFFADKQLMDKLADGAAAVPDADVGGADNDKTPMDLAATLPPNPPSPPLEKGGKRSVGESPQYFGDYKLIREIARGGMGAVYEAEEPDSGRRVALKMIAAEFATSTEAVERFRQEGRLASMVTHPRCVFVLGADQQAGRPYIVMELMPGSTLKDAVTDHGPLDLNDALAKILDVIDGLSEAHQLGVIHRDVKPSNCFLDDDGSVKIGDFGLSKSLIGDAQLTQTGRFLGTPLFASPEQIRGDPIDLRADVYSVAATLYFLLTGQAPFEGGEVAATLARIVSDPVPSMRETRPEIPKGLDAVVLRGLERIRDRRWQNLDEFRRAIVPFLPGQMSGAKPIIRTGAFLIDLVILLPLMILTDSFFLQRLSIDASVAARIAYVFVENYLWVFLYFSVLEGVWGWSLGKRLMRLRIWKTHTSDPPGFGRALLRVFVFNAFLTMTSDVLLVLYGPRQLFTAWELPWVVFSFCLFALGMLVLISTMRRRNGYRAVHDWLSGTRVVRLQLTEPRLAFDAEEMDGIAAQANGPEEIPEKIGPFSIIGPLVWSDDVKLLLAEDLVLGRRVCIRLRPASESALEQTRQNVIRSTRLRWLSSGQLDDMRWDAFASPAGCQLARFADGSRQMSWRQTRFILQQLIEELAAASADGTLPENLSIEQLWIQSTGRLQIFDLESRAFLSSDNSLSPNPAKHVCRTLLSEFAELCLKRPAKPESKSGWATGVNGSSVVVWVGSFVVLVNLFIWMRMFSGLTLISALVGVAAVLFTVMGLHGFWKNLRPLRVPLPLCPVLPAHARSLLERLYNKDSADDALAHIQSEMESTRDRPTDVKVNLRAAHLVLQGTFLFIGLFPMFFFGFGYNGWLVGELGVEISKAERAIELSERGVLEETVLAEMSDTETIHAEYPILLGNTQLEDLDRADIARVYSDDTILRQIKRMAEVDRERLKVRREPTNTLERLFFEEEFDWARRILDTEGASQNVPLTPADLVYMASISQIAPEYVQYAIESQGFDPLIWIWPVVWVAWAFLLRGGVSFRLLGLSLVRRDGRRASWLQCAGRAVLVWLPIVALLYGAVHIQIGDSGLEFVLDGLATVGGLLLISYCVLALRFPNRSLHDVLAGTIIIPK